MSGNITARSVLLGAALAPCVAWWNISVEAIRYAGQPTTVSLYPHVLFILLCLVGANRALRRLAPRHAFSAGELMTTYFFVLMAAVVASHDLVEVLVPILSYPLRYANSANKWGAEITPHIPAWLMVTDPASVDKYYIGGYSVWNMRDLSAWARPVVVWTGFLTTLTFGMFCLSAVLRRQWTEHERLAYPLAHLPVDLIQPRQPLFRSRLFWWAFALAALHDTWFGLHALWPAIPEPYTRWQTLHQSFTAPPWNAITWLPFAFFPWIMGLGVLLPVDLLFSCCVCFWIWKLQPVVASTYGYTDIPGFPFVFEQTFGAYMAIAAVTLYSARGTLRAAVASAIRGAGPSEAGEAMSSRAAVLGFLAAMGATGGFLAVCGMSWWVIAVTLAIYVLSAVAITRLRAELGTPAHDLGSMGPMRLIPLLFGTDSLRRADLAMFAPIHGFNRNYRACPMAVHAEALRAGVRTGSGLRALSAVLIVAVAWGLLCGFAADIHLNYQWGAASKADPPYVSTIFGREPYDHVTNLIRVGIAPAQRQSAVLAMGAGFTIALVLGAARLSVPGFLLHPVGYAISANWCMSLMWFSLTVAWVVKASLLRFGGNRAFRRSQPLFLGIVLGECTAGSIWMLVSAFTGTKTFIVWPYG